MPIGVKKKENIAITGIAGVGGIRQFVQQEIFYSNPVEGSLCYYIYSWAAGVGLEREYNQGKEILRKFVMENKPRKYFFTREEKRFFILVSHLMELYINLYDYKGKKQQAENVLRQMEDQRIAILEAITSMGIMD